MSDEQHLVKVLVSRGAGLSTPGQVLALETPQTAEFRKNALVGKVGNADGVHTYQLQQEVAEVGPHSIVLRSVQVGKVNHIQEETLVDVKILKAKANYRFQPTHSGFLVVPF